VNKESLVSVNITTFNRSSILPRCLDSVLSQNYQNLEIVVVDDCSGDDTSQIIKNYQKKDLRIKYFRHSRNLGNAHARNTAFKKCSGYYVAFIDDDDEWIEKNKIRKQVEIFEKSKDARLGIVCSGILRFKKNGKKLIEKAITPKDLKYEALKGGLIHNSTVLTKRQIIEEVKGFDVDVCRGIDSEFFRRVIVMYNYNVFFMKEITTCYYESAVNRLTESKNYKGYLNHAMSQYINLKKYFKFFINRPLLLLIRIFIIIQLLYRSLKSLIFNEK
jgi:glycosyltransferase involved in cell wall biosynthesis